MSKCLEIGAEVSQSVLMPKCLVAEVSSNRIEYIVGFVGGYGSTHYMVGNGDHCTVWLNVGKT